MKKIVFGVGCLIGGLLLCLVALIMAESTGASILPDSVSSWIFIITVWHSSWKFWVNKKRVTVENQKI